MKDLKHIMKYVRKFNESLIAKPAIPEVIWSDDEINQLETIGFEYDEKTYTFKKEFNAIEYSSDNYHVSKNEDSYGNITYKVFVKYHVSRGRFSDIERKKMSGVQINSLLPLKELLKNEDNFFYSYSRRRE
jgi:hypothetical protein